MLGVSHNVHAKKTRAKSVDALYVDTSVGHPIKKIRIEYQFIIRNANCAERREAPKCLGYFVWKITILRHKIIFFFNSRGGARRLRLPGSAPGFIKNLKVTNLLQIFIKYWIHICCLQYHGKNKDKEFWKLWSNL